MSLRFAKGFYKLKNPEKYIGVKTPIYRSSWEFAVFKTCDENPSFLKWASESVKIPYRDPLTGKYTVYVPDFFVLYVDKSQKQHAEIWEIKPRSQYMVEHIGKSKYNQAQYIKNTAKWAVATQWAKRNGLKFRVINETNLFHGIK